MDEIITGGTTTGAIMVGATGTGVTTVSSVGQIAAIVLAGVGVHVQNGEGQTVAVNAYTPEWGTVMVEPVGRISSRMTTTAGS